MYNVQNPAYRGGNRSTTATRSSRGAESGSGTGHMRQERRWYRWAMFWVGNILSAAVIVYEMIQLVVCFEDVAGDIGADQTIVGIKIAKSVEYATAYTYKIVMATLGFGLVIEVLSAFILSGIYKSPLDIKSVDRIPPDDLRSCLGNVLMFCVAPLSWALLYISGGAVSILYALSDPCEGQGQPWLQVYLALSGGVMMIGGTALVGFSLLVLPFFSCGSPMDCTNGCCSRARGRIHKHILSHGLGLEICWQLQCVVGSYRTGAIDLKWSLIGAACSIIGEVVASRGSPLSTAAALVGGGV